MAQITLTIADEQVDRVLTALCAHWRYDAETDGSRASFVKSEIANHLKRLVLQQERRAYDPGDPDIS